MNIADRTYRCRKLGRVVLVLACFCANSSPSSAIGTPEEAAPEKGPQQIPSMTDGDSGPENNRTPERNVGIFAGNARLGDANIGASYQCLFCPVTSGSQDFRFTQGSISGIRAELWGRYFGAAFELSSTSNIPSTFNANGSSAIIGLNSVSIIPMLRAPFFETASEPGGRLNLYGGVGLDFISWLSLEIAMPGIPAISAHVSGRNNTASPGILTMAGISWSFAHWSVFAERRSLESRIEYDGSINNFGLNPVRRVNVPVHMTHTIAGIKYRF